MPCQNLVDFLLYNSSLEPIKLNIYNLLNSIMKTIDYCWLSFPKVCSRELYPKGSTQAVAVRKTKNCTVRFKKCLMVWRGLFVS